MTESAPHLRMTAGEVPADIPSMDLARFLLNSLYGAVFRSKQPRRPNAP